jgi:endonuclease YncB( thermonuclease family)
MKSLLTVLLALILLILPYQAQASQEVQGKVMKVKDGDTIVVAPVDGEHFITCRLYGIDSPETAKRGEPGQPYGDEATKELKHMILAKNVRVITTEKDRYNRDICLITLDALDVNLEMVKRGYAWVFVRYLRKPYTMIYVAAETEAKDKRLGLWKENNPVPPWGYKNSRRNKGNKGISWRP